MEGTLKAMSFFHPKVNKMLILFLQFIASGRESYSLPAWPWGTLWKSQAKINLSFLLWFMWLFLGSILWNIILPWITLGDTYGSVRQHWTFLCCLTPRFLRSKRNFIAVVCNYVVNTRKIRLIHKLSSTSILLWKSDWPFCQAVCQQLKFFSFSMGTCPYRYNDFTWLFQDLCSVNCCM